MERREISGLEPSLLGYGGLRYRLDRETKNIDREKAAGLIRRAMEAGINYYLPAGGVPAPGKNQKTGIFLSRRL